MQTVLRTFKEKNIGALDAFQAQTDDANEVSKLPGYILVTIKAL